MRKWVKTLNNNIHADFLKFHLKCFLLLCYPAPFRLLGVSLDSFELSFLILWIISKYPRLYLYKTIWNNISLYNKNHLNRYNVWFFIKLKIVSSMGAVSIFFRTDKKFWHGVFIIFTKVCSLDVRIFDTVIYSLESHSENSQFQSFKMKKNLTFYNKGHSKSRTRLFHELLTFLLTQNLWLFAAILVDFFCSFKYLKNGIKYVL